MGLLHKVEEEFEGEIKDSFEESFFHGIYYFKIKIQQFLSQYYFLFLGAPIAQTGTGNCTFREPKL